LVRKLRLVLYLKDEEIKNRIKIAAAKRGKSITAYCTEAIKKRLIKDEAATGNTDEEKKELLARMDRLAREIGPIGMSVTELIDEGQRR